MDSEKIGTIPLGVMCTSCSTMLDITSINVISTIANIPQTCSVCNNNLDIYNLIKFSLLNGLQWNIFGLVKAKLTYYTFILQPNHTHSINLYDIGLLPDSRIINISYTPSSDGVFPLEVHGNFPNRFSYPTKLELYGKPDILDAKPTTVTVSIVWTKYTDDNNLNFLIDSFDLFTQGNYKNMILPTNLVIETKLLSFLKEYLPFCNIGNKTVNKFNDKTHYNDTLNTILPLIIDYENYYTIDPAFIANLNKLRDYRNDIAHNGVFIDSITKETFADLLASVFFVFSYLIEFELHLNTKYNQ